MRPLFIVIEGIDGAGKTTQARLLADSLKERGQKTIITCQPSQLPVGRHIRDILEHRVNNNVTPERVALMFAADRLEHLESQVMPALKEGTTVISDRYTLSSIAYQGTLTGNPRWVKEINRFAPPPDLLIYIDLTPEEAARRREIRQDPTELYETDKIQIQVARAYRELAHQMGAVFINGNQDPESMGREIWRAVEDRMKDKK